MLLRLDLAARPQAHARKQRSHGLAELGLRQEQEVLVAAAPHYERRDHTSLRGQQQRRAPLADL